MLVSGQQGGWANPAFCKRAFPHTLFAHNGVDGLSLAPLDYPHKQIRIAMAL